MSPVVWKFGWRTLPVGEVHDQPAVLHLPQGAVENAPDGSGRRAAFQSRGQRADQVAQDRWLAEDRNRVPPAHPGSMIVRRAASAAALALAIVTAPSVANTQPSPKIPRIGYLGPVSPTEGAFLLQSFRQGLRELGYVEGQNIVMDYRWAEGRPDRMPALAAELVPLRADVIFTYSNATVGALQKATRNIPIVTGNFADPVTNGFVASLARPGGNITGFAGVTEDLNKKWMELLTEAVPKTSRIAVLTVSSANHHRLWLEMQGAAGALKLTLQRQEVAGSEDIEPAFARLVGDRAQGLIVLPSAPINASRTQIVSLAAKHRRRPSSS